MMRVVVTGIGVLSALGANCNEFTSGLRAGRSMIKPLTARARDRQCTKAAAQVREFNGADHFDERKLKVLDRAAQFALVATREAVADAGIQFAGELSMRTGVVLGTSMGGAATIDESYQRLYGDGEERLHPLTVPKLMFNAAASNITIEHGIAGPSFVIASACSSANSAMAMTLQMLRSGMIEAAVTGGTEATLNYGGLKAWEALRVMAPDTCRPFSRGRQGMVLGEGAAIFVLETLGHARRRGARIHAEIIGVGMSSDASDIVAPAVAGGVSAMSACLRDAGLNAADVDYINAHGTGTAANDIAETQAIHQTFGDHARKLMVSSTKAMHGHALGAAGAIELAATILAMKHHFVPPTANFTEADPLCDLDYVANETRDASINVALSNSFAFGGHNAVVAVRRMGFQ